MECPIRLIMYRPFENSTCAPFIEYIIHIDQSYLDNQDLTWIVEDLKKDDPKLKEGYYEFKNVVANNKATRGLLDSLKDPLNVNSGHSDTLFYCLLIISCLERLWD